MSTPVAGMNKYTFLIDLGGEAITRTFSGTSRKDAAELAELSLNDDQKARIRYVVLVAVTYPKGEGNDPDNDQPIGP